MNQKALYALAAVAASMWAGACSGDSRSRGASEGTSGTSGASGTGAGGLGATGGSMQTGASGGTLGNGGAMPAGGGAGPAGGMGTAAVAGRDPAGGMGGMGGTGGTDGGDAGAGAEAGAGGATTDALGPCDIYRAAGQPCVAAYSTVRRLLGTYTGPLYQIRSGSSDQNTGSGGQTHDIGQTSNGLADASAVDAACEGTICTVSLLYDQSGRDNHLPVAKAGGSYGGPYAAFDDFESNATRDPVTVAGRRLYSLYVETRQGYRLPRPDSSSPPRDDGLPRRDEPQGIYLLADGTHAGDACCWEFGNVATNPQSFGEPNALLFGSNVGGVGAGDGPWFMADFGAGVWAGGSTAGDPGWGQIDNLHPPNTYNPSLAVKFALGFLKTQSTAWSLRMAAVKGASSVTTAYAGELPKRIFNMGGVALGVSHANENNSFGTFYEGAIVAGFPSDETENAVFLNVRELGYGE